MRSVHWLARFFVGEVVRVATKQSGHLAVALCFFCVKTLLAVEEPGRSRRTSMGRAALAALRG